MRLAGRRDPRRRVPCWASGGDSSRKRAPSCHAPLPVTLASRSTLIGHQSLPNPSRFRLSRKLSSKHGCSVSVNLQRLRGGQAGWGKRTRTQYYPRAQCDSRTRSRLSGHLGDGEPLERASVLRCRCCEDAPSGACAALQSRKRCGGVERLWTASRPHTVRVAADHATMMTLKAVTGAAATTGLTCADYLLQA